MDGYIRGYHFCTENPALEFGNLHGHDCYELLCFLEGNADYCVEGNRYRLQPGDIMLMRKGEVHTVQLHASIHYERMYIHFEISAFLEQLDHGALLSPFHDRPLGKFNHFPAVLFPDQRQQTYFRKIAESDSLTERLCYLLPLLSDLKAVFPAVKSASVLSRKEPVVPILQYINQHLPEKLSLELLSRRFYLSKTHLNRLFKQSTGTTVWEYITLKRLFRAKELIEAGQLPTGIYQQCGYCDYTTFYRAYLRHFGVSPKAHWKPAPLP